MQYLIVVAVLCLYLLNTDGSFLIGGDGYVYEGRGWVHKPPVSKRYPNLTKRIDIGYLGSKRSKFTVNFIQNIHL